MAEGGQFEMAGGGQFAWVFQFLSKVILQDFVLVNTD